MEYLLKHAVAQFHFPGGVGGGVQRKNLIPDRNHDLSYMGWMP